MVLPPFCYPFAERHYEFVHDDTIGEYDVPLPARPRCHRRVVSTRSLKTGSETVGKAVNKVSRLQTTHGEASCLLSGTTENQVRKSAKFCSESERTSVPSGTPAQARQDTRKVVLGAVVRADFKCRAALWRERGRLRGVGVRISEVGPDFLSCKLVGVSWANPGEFCCFEAHGGICLEFLLGGAKCLYYGISPPQEKLKRYLPVDCGPHRAHNKSPTRRS